MAASLTDEQIERLHLEYAQTGSYRAAARAVGVSVESARKYLKPGVDTADSSLRQMRTQKKIDIVDKIAEVQIKLLDALIDPQHLKDAGFTSIATTFGILTDKRLLLTGQATQRTETLTSDPAARLTPDEMEAAARIRAKLAHEASR